MSEKSASKQLQHHSSSDSSSEDTSSSNSWFKNIFKRSQSLPTNSPKTMDTRVETGEEWSSKEQKTSTTPEHNSMEFQKSGSFDQQSSNKLKSLPVPISRTRSETGTTSDTFSPLSRPSGGSLPIFPSLAMFSGSPVQNFGGQSLQDVNEEFDASELVLFLSQGAK